MAQFLRSGTKNSSLDRLQTTQGQRIDSKDIGNFEVGISGMRYLLPVSLSWLSIFHFFPFSVWWPQVLVWLGIFWLFDAMSIAGRYNCFRYNCFSPAGGLRDVTAGHPHLPLCGFWFGDTEHFWNKSWKHLHFQHLLRGQAKSYISGSGAINRTQDQLLLRRLWFLWITAAGQQAPAGFVWK